MPTRRHVLATVGVVASGAGCLALGSDGDETDGPGGEASVSLGELLVQNNHDDHHHVQLAVEADGEVIHLGSYELDGQTSTTVSGKWEETTARYRLHAKLDDGDVVTSDVTDGVGDDVDCVRALVRVDTDGRLGVWNGAGCENGSDPPDESS